MNQQPVLKFYARADYKVTVPGHRPMVGQVPRYVGREFAADGLVHPASTDPFVIPVRRPEAQRLVKIVRRDGTLWPADPETARACRVPFVPVELVDGEWVEAKQQTKSAARVAAGKD